jgi:hypothetical protein
MTVGLLTYGEEAEVEARITITALAVTTAATAR